ncbi:unnamed protein product [Didymodactylos carnosus]|uniref:Cupin type-1 domain-containing protein n=1 Tax=Didymodactylos carnosus TaxID=1234261 RepID=A0A815XZG0_9BILA|nr:unnamed protein product [Didymodactylos carnosus]CAF4425785.1 unnamed protein product [Didymodactylos carnosus]
MHPFAEEFFYVTSGNRMKVAFIDNTSEKLIATELREGQATVVPRDSVHYQQNLDCKPAVTLSLFNGANPLALLPFRNSFSNIPNDVIEASLGGGKMINNKLINHIKSQIANVTSLVNVECLKRCGLDKPTRPKKR